MSQIIDFFQRSSVLLTGGSGFLGKLFLERLLRVCGVRVIFVLLRSKKGVSIEDRFMQMFEIPLFDRLKAEMPDFRSRLIVIKGDCGLPNLGVANSDWSRLIQEVNVVLHCAATVRFDQTLRIAYNINVRATKDLLGKCSQMPQLKSFIYVSTAFTNCNREVIGEEVYPPPMSEGQMCSILDAFDGKDDIIATMTPVLLGQLPNTYTLTKCATEDMVQSLAVAHNLPVSIVRPSMVMSTYKEPLPGWTDNYYGPNGVSFGTALGIVRSLRCIPEYRADLVPVDYVVSAILAVAWSTAMEHSKDLHPSKVTVYNYAADDLALDWGTYMDKALTIGPELQSMRTVWPVMLHLHRYAFIHRLSRFWLHTVPAYIIDTVLVLIGKRPRMVEVYKKLHYVMSAVDFFSTHQFRFETENLNRLWEKLNTADQGLFEFRMSTLDWDEYMPNFLLGGRVFLCKDPLSTLPAARRRYKKLVFAFWFLKIVLVSAVLSFFIFVFGLFSN